MAGLSVDEIPKLLLVNGSGNLRPRFKMRTWGTLRVIKGCEWERVSQPDRIHIEEDDSIVGAPGSNPRPRFQNPNLGHPSGH